MRPVAQGRPGNEVVPTGWAAAHRPTVEAVHKSACTIRAPGGTAGTFDGGTGEYTGQAANTVHYSGPCTIVDLPAFEREQLVASEQIPTVGYLVKVAADAAQQTKVGHIVKITSIGADGPPHLVGVELSVRSLEGEAYAWERALICTQNQS